MMIKQNKKDKIIDPIDGDKIDDKTINEIIKKYQKKEGLNHELKSDYKKIIGCSLINPINKINKKSGKGFTKLVVNREKNGIKMLPFTIGYLPNDYEVPDLDLQIYSIIGTISEIFIKNKMFTKESDIDNLELNSAFDIMKLKPEETFFIDDYHDKITKININTKEGYNEWLYLEDNEDKSILNNLLVKWWKLNPEWKQGKPLKKKYIFRIELLDKLKNDLNYLCNN